MSDLISREKAMMEARPEYLNPNQKGHEEYNKAWNDGVKAYWNGLKELPSESEWIPCSERLPEERKVVLITNDKGNVRYGQFRGTHGMYWYWKGNTLEEVIAWMELPESYREDGES